MASPNPLTFLKDRLHLLFRRGIRIRIWNDPHTGFHLRILGDQKSLRSNLDRLHTALLDLKPAGEGTIDAYMKGPHCAIEVQGSINENNLEQRLRNILHSRA